MDKLLEQYLNKITKNKVTVYKSNFIANLEGYQILAVLEKEKYDVTILKNYIPLQKGKIKKDDLQYFLVYVSNQVCKV